MVIVDIISEYGIFVYIYFCVIFECYWYVFDNVFGLYLYLICFVVKLNFNIVLLNVMVKFGFGFDIVL